MEGINHGWGGNNIETQMLNQSKYQESSAQVKAADFDEPRHESGLAVRDPTEMTGVSNLDKGRDPMTISSLSPNKKNMRSGLNV